MKRELIFTFCCLLTTLVWSQEYQRTETGIKASIFGKKIDVEVQWFNANSLRVLKMPHGQSVDKKSLSVIARPEKTALKVSTSEDGNIVMKSRLLTVKLDTKTGVLIYETRNGMPLLKEIVNLLESNLYKRCEDQLGIHLTITAALKEHLVSKYADNKMGARPLKRAIQSVVDDALAEEILQKKVVPGDKVSAGFKDGKVVFTVKN